LASSAAMAATIARASMPSIAAVAGLLASVSIG
jgi:hypothetical protein